MALKTTIKGAVFERTTRRLTCTIVNQAGTGFKPETLTLLLYDVETGSVINSRNRVSVLDTNGGTVSAEGALEMWLDPEDNIIVAASAAGTKEVHRALFEWSWAGGTRFGKHEVEFAVENNSKVP